MLYYSMNSQKKKDINYGYRSHFLFRCWHFLCLVTLSILAVNSQAVVVTPLTFKLNNEVYGIKVVNYNGYIGIEDIYTTDLPSTTSSGIYAFGDGTTNPDNSVDFYKRFSTYPSDTTISISAVNLGGMNYTRKLNSWSSVPGTGTNYSCTGANSGWKLYSTTGIDVYIQTTSMVASKLFKVNSINPDGTCNFTFYNGVEAYTGESFTITCESLENQYLSAEIFSFSPAGIFSNSNYSISVNGLTTVFNKVFSGKAYPGTIITQEASWAPNANYDPILISKVTGSNSNIFVRSYKKLVNNVLTTEKVINLSIYNSTILPQQLILSLGSAYEFTFTCAPGNNTFSLALPPTLKIPAGTSLTFSLKPSLLSIKQPKFFYYYADALNLTTEREKISILGGIYPDGKPPKIEASGGGVAGPDSSPFTDLSSQTISIIPSGTGDAVELPSLQTVGTQLPQSYTNYSGTGSGTGTGGVAGQSESPNPKNIQQGVNDSMEDTQKKAKSDWEQEKDKAMAGLQDEIDKVLGVADEKKGEMFDILAPGNPAGISVTISNPSSSQNYWAWMDIDYTLPGGRTGKIEVSRYFVEYCTQIAWFLKLAITILCGFYILSNFIETVSELIKSISTMQSITMPKFTISVFGWSDGGVTIYLIIRLAYIAIFFGFWLAVATLIQTWLNPDFTANSISSNLNLLETGGTVVTQRAWDLVKFFIPVGVIISTAISILIQKFTSIPVMVFWLIVRNVFPT